MTPPRPTGAFTPSPATRTALLLALLLGGAPRSLPAAPSPDGAAPAAESLTVAQCVARARAAAPDVRSRLADAQAARLDSAAAARNGAPAYSLFGGAVVAPRGFYDPVVTDLGQYALKLGLELPLLDAGSRRRDRQQAALAAAGAVVELERATRDAGLRAAEVALGWLRQRELADSDRETLAWLDRLAALIESGVRSGARERADAVRVQIERDAVESEQLSIAEVRGVLARELAELTDLADPPALAEPEAAEDAPPAAADSLDLLARVERGPEVRAARFTEASARLALEQARRANAVRVDFALDAGLAGADLTRAVPLEFALSHPGATFSDRLRQDLGASLSLQFRRPLFDPARASGIAAREAALAAAASRTAAVRAQRRRETLDLLARWRAAAGRLDLARAALGRAEEHLLRLRSLYAGGASSLLELLDARRQVDDARARLADARFELRVAHWQGELQP
jgi:outer membrane protein TolC